MNQSDLEKLLDALDGYLDARQDLAEVASNYEELGASAPSDFNTFHGKEIRRKARARDILRNALSKWLQKERDET